MPTSAGGNYAGPLRMNKRQISVIPPRNVALCRRCGRRHRKSSDSQFVAQVVAPLTRHYHRQLSLQSFDNGASRTLTDILQTETWKRLRLAPLTGYSSQKRRRRLPVRFVDCWLPSRAGQPVGQNPWLNQFGNVIVGHGYIAPSAEKWRSEHPRYAAFSDLRPHHVWPYLGVNPWMILKKCLLSALWRHSYATKC